MALEVPEHPRLDLIAPMPKTRTEWNLLSHHCIPSNTTSSSSSKLVGILDFYITRKQRVIIVQGLDEDVLEYYDSPPRYHRRLPLPPGPLVHDRVISNYLLSRLSPLGVDTVAIQKMATRLHELVCNAIDIKARQIHVAVDIEIISIDVVNATLTNDDLSEVWDSEEEEEEDLMYWGRCPVSEKSIMKLNEASFVANNEASDGLGTCVVCLGDLSSTEGSNIDRRLTKLPCTHVFHNLCIVPWLERNGTCPLCRRELVED